MNQCNFAFYLPGQSVYHADNNQGGFYGKQYIYFFWFNTENVLRASLLRRWGELSEPGFKVIFWLCRGGSGLVVKL